MPSGVGRKYQPASGHHQAGLGEAEGADQQRPDGGEDHAAQAGAVIGHGQRRGPPPVEPRGDEGIDRRAAGHRPAHGGQQRRRHQLPGMLGKAPAEHAERAGQHPRPGHRHQAEASVQPRQDQDDRAAGQEMQGDGGGDEAGGPAFPGMQGVQIDRGPIKVDAPAEHCDHEGSRDDMPAEKAFCCDSHGYPDASEAQASRCDGPLMRL
jgi:hypothetical protein